MIRRVVLTWMLSITFIIGGCFESGGGNDAGKRSSGNTPPQISGSPTQSVLQGTSYEFMPAATDADGDKLKFTIARKPGWAKFDRKSGRLTGTPSERDVGTYANIGIAVTDGRTSTSLQAFGITVTQSASGSVTLSWLPPTENADGTVLSDLAGYKIYVGQSADALDRVIVLDNPGLTLYVVEDLSPATWHFAMTSVNSSGSESQRSATVSKDVG